MSHYNHSPHNTNDHTPRTPPPISKLTISITFLTLAIISTTIIHISPLSSPPPHRHLTTTTPSIAWLLSFPNSGTTYTLRLIESTTQRTTATNYGHEHINTATGTLEHISNSIPISPGDINGPFRLSDYELPDNGGYLLTKTHCGGYCFSDCPPHWFILPPEKFLGECVRGARFEERTISSSDGPRTTTERYWVRYDPIHVERAVHLLRDPFDNVVSRFHHEYATHHDLADGEWTDRYPRSAEGFREWCRASDERFRDTEAVYFEREVVRRFQEGSGVLCHGEFFRWVQWHNNAFEVTERLLDVPVLVVHYMDLEMEGGDGLVERLLGFLEQERVVGGEIPKFNMRTYDGAYYTIEERMKIVEFLEYMASETTWREMSRYEADVWPRAVQNIKIQQEQEARDAAAAVAAKNPDTTQDDGPHNYTASELEAIFNEVLVAPFPNTVSQSSSSSTQTDLAESIPASSAFYNRDAVTKAGIVIEGNNRQRN